MNDLRKTITLKSHRHTHTHTHTHAHIYTKQVGVLVDEYLTFKAHIESVKWKLAKASGILAK